MTPQQEALFRDLASRQPAPPPVSAGLGFVDGPALDPTVQPQMTQPMMAQPQIQQPQVVQPQMTLQYQMQVLMMQGYQPLMQNAQGLLMRNAMGQVVLVPFPAGAPSVVPVQSGDGSTMMLGVQSGQLPGGRPGYSGLVRMGTPGPGSPQKLDGSGSSLGYDSPGSLPKLVTESIRELPPLKWAIKSTVKVIDAKGLPEGIAGCYVSLHLGEDEEFTTATKWNESKPFWSENFTFDVPDRTNLTVKLWLEAVAPRDIHEVKAELKKREKDSKEKSGKKKKGKDDDDDVRPVPLNSLAKPYCVGVGEIVFDTIQQSDKAISVTVPLKCPPDCPKPVTTPLSMRFDVTLNKSPVVDMVHYSDMVNILLNDKDEFALTRFISSPAAQISQGDSGEIAKMLMAIAEFKTKAVPLLYKLIDDEVAVTKSTAVLFRANTVACRAIDDYMRLIAMPWLKCLGPGAEWIAENDQYYCELDKEKLTKEDDPEENLLDLHMALGRQQAAIMDAADKCPRNLALIFYRMRTSAEAKFTDDDKVKWTSVSGLVFLRFFVPALREPRKFGLIKRTPSPNAERNFIIVAQILQKLSNIKSFDIDSLYWNKLDNWLRMNLHGMEEFLDKISAKRVPPKPVMEFPAPKIDLPASCAYLARLLKKYVSVIEKSESKDASRLIAELSKIEKVTDEAVELHRLEAEKKRKASGGSALDSSSSSVNAPTTPMRHSSTSAGSTSSPLVNSSAGGTPVTPIRSSTSVETPDHKRSLSFGTTTTAIISKPEASAERPALVRNPSSNEVKAELSSSTPAITVGHEKKKSDDVPTSVSTPIVDGKKRSNSAASQAQVLKEKDKEKEDKRERRASEKKEKGEKEKKEKEEKKKDKEDKKKDKDKKDKDKKDKEK